MHAIFEQLNYSFLKSKIKIKRKCVATLLRPDLLHRSSLIFHTRDLIHLTTEKLKASDKTNPTDFPYAFKPNVK